MKTGFKPVSGPRYCGQACKLTEIECAFEKKTKGAKPKESEQKLDTC